MGGNDYSFESIMNSIIFNLFDAIKKEFEIRLNGLLNYENYKFYLTLTINTLNSTIKAEIIRTFRNQHLIEKINFIDEKFAIFQGINLNQIFIYDLRQEQEFYDPITEMNLLHDMTIQSYNSTHYICFNSSSDEAFLIEIGYEINFMEKDKPYDCKLIAENGVSKAEVLVTIQQEEINNDIHYKSIIILSIIVCIVIVLLIFVLRRQKLKKNNLKLFQPISLDQSKLQ
ncbi:unnamed protein product [Paramecium octaurelia]|uniref:Uncharacterized protein n=1 Tax=Paramecium octaurelia TaxID=43137 RepID=A0A8S1YL57_PAROT|nr:unnamed protein product [Paramecium octaurelia]